MPDAIYTYRGGQKLALNKADNQFVVRADFEEIDGVTPKEVEPVSSVASRITVTAGKLEDAMKRARKLAPAHHAYYAAESGDEFLITDRVLVRFKGTPAAAQIDEFMNRYALLKLAEYTPRDFLFQLTDHTGMNPVKLIVKLNEEETALVEMADHDLNQRISSYALALPTDPFYLRQWHLHRRTVDAQVDARSSARCEEAWQALDSFGSSDVVVAVTDDGCKLDHPDFAAANKFAGWGYFEGSRLVVNTDIDAVPARMYQTGSNHGTSCAGVIAGDANGRLTVGAAPNARLLPIKWESVGPSLAISDSKLLTALLYLESRADIVSNSWGRVPTSTWSFVVIDKLRQLAVSGGRRGKGMLFLFAAGNDNCPIQHNATIDVPFDSGWRAQAGGSATWVGVRTARNFQNNMVGIPGVMFIAALSSAAQRSHYSNYGNGIALCAPTNNIHLYRRLTVRGLGVITATGQTGDVTDRFGGTSSATPLVAGAAALALSANAGLTALELESALKRTASKDLDFTPYSRTPPAPTFDPNPTWDVSPVAPFDQGAFQNAGLADGTWSPWFGFGKVDALALVNDVRRGSAQPVVTRVQFAAQPNSAIPDNNLNGARSVIRVNDDGVVAAIQVEVSVRHTWIGDLRIRLIAPDGTTATLHNRTGSSADDIRRTYSESDTTELALLRNTATKGDWTLHVQDLAAADRGVLERWALRLDIVRGPVIANDDAGISIPAERSLAVPVGRTARSIAVSVDITHPALQTVSVALQEPGGATIPLLAAGAAAGDHLAQTWSSANIPALSALTGREAGGVWRLAVQSPQAGKLNQWRIAVE